MMMSNIDSIFDSVRREVMIAFERSRPGDKITVFLSGKLFALLKGACLQEMQYRLNQKDGMAKATLFGCDIEVFDDRGLAFYVTTARKIEL